MSSSITATAIPSFVEGGRDVMPDGQVCCHAQNLERRLGSLRFTRPASGDIEARVGTATGVEKRTKKRIETVAESVSEIRVGTGVEGL